MSKSEFLKELEEALRGEVEEAVIQENLRYYRNYIDDEVRKGNPEETVIQTLGSGRIIAKTVIEAHGNGRYGKQGTDNQSYHNAGYKQENESHRNGITWKTKIKWSVMIGLIVLLLIGILGLVLHIVWALLPFLLIAYIVYYFLKK